MDRLWGQRVNDAAWLYTVSETSVIEDPKQKQNITKIADYQMIEFSSKTISTC